jgi:hypothetical protein
MKSHRTARFPASSQERAHVLARYRASGLGLKAFALKEGLPPGRLHYWVYQKSAGASSRRPARPTPAAATLGFQEIPLPCRPEGGGEWAAEVALAGGLAVRFSASASAEWLASVVQALRRPC